MLTNALLFEADRQDPCHRPLSPPHSRWRWGHHKKAIYDIIINHVIINLLIQKVVPKTVSKKGATPDSKNYMFLYFYILRN